MYKTNETCKNNYCKFEIELFVHVYFYTHHIFGNTKSTKTNETCKNNHCTFRMDLVVHVYFYTL